MPTSACIAARSKINNIHTARKSGRLKHKPHIQAAVPLFKKIQRARLHIKCSFMYSEIAECKRLSFQKTALPPYSTGTRLLREFL